MPTIETLTGPVDTADLGTVLMHEHIFVLSPELQTAYPGHNGWDRDAEVAKAQKTLKDLKEAGVDTILELSVVGTGRDVELMREAVEGSGLQVIVATGLYTYDVLPRQFHFMGPDTMLNGPEPMDALFLRDINEGIQGTPIKPAILKCATDEAGMTPHVVRVFQSVIRVHKETNLPINTHTHAPTERGLEQQELLRSEGVDLSRVIIGHCGDTTDLDYLEKLIDAGSIIGMDRFGIDVQLPFTDRVNTVAALCEKGYAERMVLSHDAACFIDWFPRGLQEEITPKWNYHHIHNDVLPALRERGVSDEQIEAMLVHNPRRFFEAS